MNWKDISIRALKTFLQAFVGSLAIALSSMDFTDLNMAKSALLSALIAAAAAGLSAIMNMAINYLKKFKGE